MNTRKLYKKPRWGIKLVAHIDQLKIVLDSLKGLIEKVRMTALLAATVIFSQPLQGLVDKIFG